MEIVFGLIVGWALGVATAVMWPRGKLLPPLGGPPRVHGGYQPLPGRGEPTNPPQGTGAAKRRPEAITFHFHGHPDDFEQFRANIEKWLDEQERRPQCPVT